MSQNPTATIVAAVIASLSVAIFSGCSGAKTMTIDPAAVLAKVSESYESVPKMTLRGELQSNAIPVTITFDAWVDRRDALKMILTAPFGMNAGALVATPERFTVVSTIEGIVYRGKPDRATFGRAARLAVSWNELVALLRAEIPRIPTAEDLASGRVTTEQDGGDLHIIERSGDTITTIVVDADDYRVSRYEQHREVDGADPEKLIEVSYKTWAYDLGGRDYPEKASLRINDGETWIKVTIDRAKAGIPDDVSMGLEVPDDFDARDL